jgi:hypothetical protein
VLFGAVETRMLHPCFIPFTIWAKQKVHKHSHKQLTQNILLPHNQEAQCLNQDFEEKGTEIYFKSIFISPIISNIHWQHIIWVCHTCTYTTIQISLVLVAYYVSTQSASLPLPIHNLYRKLALHIINLLPVHRSDRWNVLTKWLQKEIDSFSLIPFYCRPNLQNLPNTGNHHC